MIMLHVCDDCDGKYVCMQYQRIDTRSFMYTVNELFTM